MLFLAYFLELQLEMNKMNIYIMNIYEYIYKIKSIYIYIYTQKMN